MTPNRTVPELSRRGLLHLLGGAVGLAAAAGCSAGAPLQKPAGTTPSAAAPSARAAAGDSLAALERRFGGRLGLFATDTATGATVAHRGGERFLMCSTVKVLICGAVLRRAQDRPGLLDQVIRYRSADLLEHAPVTSLHVADGMTVAALCEAMITVSDNTAANLLSTSCGGPPAITAFARSLGDGVTRADRLEPELNDGGPGDERDTSTPAQMAADLRLLVLGTGGSAALAPDSRARLTGWLRANTTGTGLIRAGVPGGWTVGDKTGSGSAGQVNDVAVVWPPGRAPLVIAIYTAPADPNAPAEMVRPVLAEATRIAVTGLG